MPVIHIQTDLISSGKYEFTQTWCVGETNADERTFTESHEDRMYAAMTNLGYACKWYGDKNITHGDICIVTDTDGKDQRYNGEHDDLYKAIRSSLDYQHNRAKYALIYGRYVRFLDRIRDLADTFEITFSQNDRSDADAPEVKETRAPLPLTKFQKIKWTRENIISLSFIGRENVVKCNACQKKIIFQQTDTFKPFRMFCGKDNKGHDRFAMVRSNKQRVKNFQEIHLGMHLNRGL